MRTFKQQRREFVLLAMKLIEKFQDRCHLQVSLCGKCIFEFYDICFNPLKNLIIFEKKNRMNERAITKLKDLLKGGK